MKSEQESIKGMIDKELAELRFGRQADVLKRTHPRAWRDHLRVWWNKELQLPLLPIGLSCVLLITIATAVQLSELPNSHDAPPPQHRELIETGGNTYWSDEFEKAVGAHESYD
jgi:hypothetical protein